MKKMTTTKLYCGIDMSADTFDICMQTDDQQLVWHKFEKNTSG
jgi:hypothetical protein